MKKIIFLASLIIVFAAIFYFYTKQSSSTYVADITSVKLEETAILLYPESGEVSYKLKSDGPFQIATASPTIIPNNAIVHTGIGKASILLPDNSSVSLDQNTEITVNYSANKTSMYQNFGTTYHRVQKLITGGSYQVQTAGTLAAVRGTKFAVSYDIKKKKTKIAVTESKVEVSTITKATTTGTSTPVQEENLMLEAGKTVTVDMESPKKEVDGKRSVMLMVDTKADVEMNTFVEEKKKGDAAMEMIKTEEREKKMDKQEVRKEIKRVLFNDDADDKEIKKDEARRDDENVETKKVTESTKEEVKETKKAEVIAPKTTTTVKTETKVIVPVVKEIAPTITKMDEEKFFTLFEPLFIKYFYIDETDSICSISISPEDRVKAVSVFATNRGYDFTKVTLPSFARAIDEYCANKDKAVKARLQARFDDEYPF